MNDVARKPNTHIASPSSEAQAIAKAADQDVGFQKMLKFKKGDYWCDNEEVPKGTTYIAHAVGWTKTWVHFESGMVVERRIYPMKDNPVVPERDELPNNDQSTWPPGIDDRPADPWVLQYLLPMENPNTGDIHVFVSGSYGGKRAIGDLCANWARRNIKNPDCGQPIVKLQKAMMPTKKFGDVPRPYFEVVGWDDARTEMRREVDIEKVEQHQFDDQIPF